MFVLTSVERQNVKRRRGKGEEIKRNWSLKYSFKNLDGKNVSVCKHFFLATLGYKPKNDSFVFKICSSIEDKNKNAIVSPIIDKNNRSPWNKLNEESLKSIKSHIDSFNPCVSHYRRAHAPNMRYLPNEVNANFMYEDFKKKFSDIKCSYDAYRKVLRDNNISFTKLGHEECEQCEEWKQHNANHSKDTLNLSSNTCNVCKKYEVHLELYTQARSLYESHKKELNSDSKLTVSVDLQKVIMLPRMECFKAAIFTKRIIVFNESFVPIGKKNKVKPLAIIWHEGVSGRKQEDLTSCFFQFLLFNKDVKNISIWMDNCAAQNKNWCLLTFLIYVINSHEIETTEINLFYFEPGHSFMSADSFHHQVELSMKNTGKVYDFMDFEKVIRKCNSGHVDAKVMDLKDFYDWKSECSVYKLNKQNIRPMLSDIVHIKAERGLNYLLYKTDYSEYCPFRKLDFLKNNIIKNGISKPDQKTKVLGIHPSKKESIIKTLVPLMPETRKQFWLDFPCAIDAPDLYSDNEN